MARLQQMATSEANAEQNCCCNCKRKLDPYQLFDDNVEDIAKSLAQIMIICGINTTKACNARSIIRRAFIYHEKLRTRCPKIPPQGTHLHRDDMLQALRIKCEMDNVEAMLTYAIIKRAFKAFFHGKPDRSISNPIMDTMAIHNQKAAWLHASYRTARIFDNYRAVFFWAHKSYEKQITIVYRSLYDRMSARANPLTVPACTCRNCSKQEVPGVPKPGEKDKHDKFKLASCADLSLSCILCGLQVPKIEPNVRVKRPRPIMNHEVKLPRCGMCNSPMLICECNIDQLTGEQFGECGQDSYKVRWYRLEDELKGEDTEDTDQHKQQNKQQKKQKPKPAKKTEIKSSKDMDTTSFEDALEPTIDWENHHCPIDCLHSVCSESSNVCHEHEPTSSMDKAGSEDSNSSFGTCSDFSSEDVVDKLEKYLNLLWAEEVAEKKNPKTFVPSTVFPPRQPCEPCKR